MIEETPQSENAVQNDSCSVQNDVQINSLDVGKAKDNKKEKCRPMTKVYILINSHNRYKFLFCKAFTVFRTGSLNER